MGLLSSFASKLGIRRKADVTYGTLELWRRVFGWAPSKTGITVTLDRALQVSTVLACARVIAEDVASMPFQVVSNEGGAHGEPRPDHHLWELLDIAPNEWQTGFEFFETNVIHNVLCGNGYAFKNVVRGRVKELIPFVPGQVEVKRADNYALRYFVRGENGKTQEFPAEAIWHTRGPSLNSWMGLDIVRQAREAIGLAIATEESQALLHANGLRTSGVYTVEGSLEEGQYERLKKWIDDNHGGGENLLKPMLLDRNAKWTPYSMTGVDAQHLESRLHQVTEICRAMRVIPIMVGHSDKLATYASAEQMFLAHNNIIGKWCRRLDKSGDKNLLSRDDYKAGIRLRHQINALMYADVKAKAAWYTAMYMIGAINPNEIRAFEHMKPYGEGDQFRVPANMLDPAKETAAVVDAIKAMVEKQPGLLRDWPAMEVKIGRVLSARNEKRISGARDELSAVLAELVTEDPPTPAPTE